MLCLYFNFLQNIVFLIDLMNHKIIIKYLFCNNRNKCNIKFFTFISDIKYGRKKIKQFIRSKENLTSSYKRKISSK